MTILGRRSFFTVIGAAVASIKAAPAAQPVFSSHACILCGFENNLTSWCSTSHPGVVRCTDRSGCQARQINALLGTQTLWQERTGVIMAKGKRT